MKKIILIITLCLNNTWAVASNRSSTVLMDLDMIYSPGDTAEDISRNIGYLTNRIVSLQKQGLKSVQLAAFSNPNGSKKTYSNVFFPSIHLKESGNEIRFPSPIGESQSPYSGNLFARAAKAIKVATQGKVKIYAWMPILSYRVKPDSNYFWGVEYVKSDLSSENNDPNRYKRLTPFSPVTWDIVADIYADLAISAGQYLDGIAFHDDGMISDHEDVSDSAIWFYENVWGYGNVTHKTDSITSDPILELQWAEKKAAYINHFTLYMAEVANRFIADYHDRNIKLKTSRHIYASALTDKLAYLWLGQDPVSLYEDYDSVSIEAYPYMEERFKTSSNQELCLLSTSTSNSCLKVYEVSFYYKLISAAKKYDSSLQRTMFIFQSVDWRDGSEHWLPDYQLGGSMIISLNAGVQHIAWYPDLYFPDANFPYVLGRFQQAINKTR